MTLEKQVAQVLDEYKNVLRVVKNSVVKLLDLSSRGEDSLYLDIMYKYKTKYALGIVKDDKTKDAWLIDATSIKELVKHGYICNMTYIESNNTITGHKNKIIANGYTEYKVEYLENKIDYLVDTYGCVLTVDDELKCVGRLRHSINGICFNINSEIIYFKVVTPINKKILSVEEFRRLLVKKRDKGRFCINVTGNNAALAHNYVLIEHDQYEKMVNTLDASYLEKIKIKPENSKNEVLYTNINYKIAKVIFKDCAVIALPIPSKFETKEEFKSSFYETEIDNDKFVIYNYSNIDIESLKLFLSTFYDNIKEFDANQIVDCVRQYENTGCTGQFEEYIDIDLDSAKTKDLDDVEDSIKITDLTYVTDDCDIRLVVKYNTNTDRKYIVLIRDNYKDNEIIIPNSEASYKDYLYGNLDIQNIKKSIHTILKDFNNTRKIDDILEELGLV